MTLSAEAYKDFFYSSQAPMLIIGIDAPHYTMLDVNDAYLHATHTTREDIIGKPVFGAFPANPGDVESKNIELTIFSFEQAISTGKTHVMHDYRYDIPIPGTDEFEERYWSTSNTPILDEQGKVKYFIHSPTNVTEIHKLNIREQENLRNLQEQQEQLFSTFMQAPVGIAILKGDNFIVDLINPSLCQLYSQQPEDIIDKPIFDVLTHAKGLGFQKHLIDVRLSGKPYVGQQIAVPLLRNEVIEDVYVNFVFEPFRDTDGSITGVIVVTTEVSELVNVKNVLEEAEERARLAVDAVGLGTFDLDLISGEMITSRTFANLFGFPEPVPRTEYVKAIHEEDRAARKKAHEDALITGNLFYETRVIWKDQSVHWLRIEGKVYYSDNRPYRILGTLLDITEQRIAKEQQEKLNALVENSVDLMSILRMDGINSYINEAGRQLLGFENENDVETTPISELHTPEDLETVKQVVIPSVLQTGRWSGEMNVRHLKTGEIFPVLNNCFRINDPATNLPIAIGAVMRDLRPELEAKKALAESERILRNVTSATPTGLWMSDAEGLVTYINQTWVEWTGRTYDQNLGFGWLNSIVKEDRQQVKEKLTADVSAKQNFEAEFRLNHKDGSVHWCIVNGKPQYRPDGIFDGYIGACVDITDQKQLQRQKDDFIGIASHELKTPVTTIKGYAQVLEKMFTRKGDAREAEMMRRMDKQVKRLTNLIGDLLDVTKINAGKLQFNNTDFDFNPMVAELVEDLQRTTDSHTLILEFSEAGFVFGDKVRIGQVIANLITNAIKYSPGKERIVIKTGKENNEVTLCVEDEGIGIPENMLNKVFEQFYRVSGEMQHTFPGLGLGLYISSEIIKREGGRIWVNSRVGEGSTFCFALPLSSSARENN